MGTRRSIGIYEWDEHKRHTNLAKHDIDFAVMDSFEWDTALEFFDGRHQEPRWTVIGFVGLGLYVATYTVRADRIRVISLRKATPQERTRYAEA